MVKQILKKQGKLVGKCKSHKLIWIFVITIKNTSEVEGTINIEI
jgi:hypothetical protein